MLNDATRQAVLSRAQSHAQSTASRCELLFSITAVAESVSDLIHRTLARHELTETGFNVLGVLASHEPDVVTAEEVARDVHLVRANAGHAVAQLELAGMLAVRRTGTGRREARLHLTPRGRRAFSSGTKACVEAIGEFTAPLDDAQAGQAATSLALLRTISQPLISP